GANWRAPAAGAITAALVAANFQIDELERIVGGLNYMEFLTQKTSWLIWNGNPADDLRSPVRLIFNLLISRRLGEYNSDPFRDWLQDNLQQRGLKTFKDIRNSPFGADLKVIVSDITSGEMLVLPDDLEIEAIEGLGRPKLIEQLGLRNRDEFSIAEAVRLSMSIPFFFQPGKLGSRRIVDGGILSNFPLWVYDVPTQAERSSTVRRCPRWPTFGLRLTEEGFQKQAKIAGPFDMLGAMFKTMMVAHDRHHLNQSNQGRVINIDVTEARVTATEFDISDSKKDILYQLGYQQAKEFFHTWNWSKHLELRGFDPADLIP
ncbi:MAG: phospholipase, partial [Leptolyngbyaceae cyanobacterium RM1_406_9]|nr:phospholipase [Leptolyngbyaceae cyanobacterium RM1_406_9]